MASDSDDRAGDPFGVTDLARGLLGDEDAVEEFDEAIDRLAPGAAEELIDSAVGRTIVGVADARSQVAEAQAERDDDAPIVQYRERELQDGSIAVRAFVGDTDVRAYAGEQSVLLRGDGWDDEQLLGFEPASIERQDDGDGPVAEFLILPPGAEPIDTDYPEEDDDEEEEENGVEAALEEVDEPAEDIVEDLADDDRDDDDDEDGGAAEPIEAPEETDDTEE